MSESRYSRNDRQRRSTRATSNYRCQHRRQNGFELDPHDPYFGHPPSAVPEDWFRIGCININNLPPLRNETADAELCTQIHKYEIEVLLMQEPGVNWSLVPRHHQWLERNKSSFPPNSVSVKFGFNTHDLTGSKQVWGGTGIVSLGKLKHYSMGAGVDASGLGRWTWARYRGHNGVVLRVVSVYRPTPPNPNQPGTLSVHAQQRIHFQSRNDDRDPRAAFLGPFHGVFDAVGCQTKV